MRLLLDTQTWVWMLLRPERVNRVARRAIENAARLYISPVSIWETRHLVERGRVRISEPYWDWINAALSRLPVAEAQLTFAVALEAARIVLPQPDPGDVFIAATAVVHDLTLVTSDAQLLRCSWLKTISAD